MKIPPKFTLGAQKWEVKLLDELPESLGQTNYETTTILLRKNSKKCVLELTFCHELIHAFMFATGRVDNHDELLVDGMAHYLHQYLVENYKE